ncbi:hypothetical protein GCM10011533_35750 [Streptosporangium jomthongense]|uniref:DUF1853 family protein n=1 Tax=Marinobacter aromaticivorans TaxID=1494078 RepID=A0ABW2J0D5_9GAMM|nr:DUF1853 family protein [Marinobacter aromaticivorans]GGE80166.1 hypothetical protein GCM10011533_35750 [Streptosporangium jomthongense]
MDANFAPHLFSTYRTPAVRHLAWLCQAPQLLSAPITFEPARHLPSSYRNILEAWDQDNKTAPALLSEPPQPRLGFYFERLYQVLLEDLLGWPILLKNQQIQSHGRTIGELDFVVHNRADNRIEHHEIAIKFYLGVPEQTGITLWYGPNARDRLDLKTTSLLEQQSRRTWLPETISMLSEAGITAPLTPQIFMPGYLYYPDAPQVLTPDYVPDTHLRGHWMYACDTKTSDTSHWVLLNKPHWIGNWFQAEPPDAERALEALERVEKRGVPQLFAVLQEDHQTGIWEEVDRVFVVPETWP